MKMIFSKFFEPRIAADELSVDIIACVEKLAAYNSQLDRRLSYEHQKRARSLATWKLDDVIDVDSSKLPTASFKIIAYGENFKSYKSHMAP
ncbi:hypothetical protein L1887_21658 [Cichorium endivia]|nr:hypothetical protein L1887_21658 [Cichorium endivia]